MKYLPQRPVNEVYGIRAEHQIQTDLSAVSFEPRGGPAFERLLADVPELLEEIAQLRTRVSDLEEQIATLE